MPDWNFFQQNCFAHSSMWYASIGKRIARWLKPSDVDLIIEGNTSL